MRLAAFVLLALVGCGNSVGDDAPIYGGGGGSGGGETGGGDASPQIDSGTDGGSLLQGNVCLVTDARFLTTFCQAADVNDLLVTLATYTARTLADGSFMIVPGGDSLTLWHVSSDAMSAPDILPTVQQVSLSPIISAFSRSEYDTLLTSNAAVQVDGTGGVFLRLTHNDAPQPGVSASTTQSTYTFYDNDQSGAVWQTGSATSTNGVVWIPNALPDGSGNVSVVLTPSSGSVITANVKVVPGNLTFATIAFP